MGTEAPGHDHAPAAADAGGAGGAGAGRSAVFLPALLALAIVAVLLPAVLVKEQSGAMLAKVAAAALLSLLPGWLYVQFIKNKGHSLYDEYVLNLFRLHIDEYANLPAPPQHTSHHKLWKEHHDELEVDTKDNLYREKFQSVYGRGSVSTLDFIDRDRAADDRRRRMQAQTKTFSPVLLATFLFALGWALVLQPERWTELEVFGDALSDQPELPNQMLRFGFVGAYAFILQDIVRRYFRDDLKASAYVAGVVRIVFVTLVLVAVNLVVSFDAITDVGDRDLRAALAFLVGFFPQLGCSCCTSPCRSHSACSSPPSKSSTRSATSTASTSGTRPVSPRRESRTCRTSSRPTSSISCCTAVRPSPAWSTGSTRRCSACTSRPAAPTGAPRRRGRSCASWASAPPAT